MASRSSWLRRLPGVLQGVRRRLGAARPVPAPSRGLRRALAAVGLLALAALAVAAVVIVPPLVAPELADPRAQFEVRDRAASRSP